MLATTKLISAEEYLSIERAAKEKHELHEGHIVTMTGASISHNRISKKYYWHFVELFKRQILRSVSQ